MHSFTGHLEKGVRRRLSVATFISLFAFLLTYLQIFGESKDYSQYEIFFDLLRLDGLNVFSVTRFEPAFVVVAILLVQIFSSDIVVYSAIVSAAMFLKGMAMCRISKNTAIVFVVAAFYLVRYFPLHELTQLRVAVSGAFLLWAALFFGDGKRLYGLTACAMAMLFHMSAIVVIPSLLARPARWWAVILIATVTFIVAAFGVRILTDALGDTLQVVAMYERQGYGENAPNPLSSALLLDWAMIFFGFTMWPRLSPPMKHVLFMEVIGMAIFYAAIDFAVISHRSRELFSVFWIIFIAYGIRAGMLIKLATVGFVVVSICLYLYLFIFNAGLFV